jgi:UDP-2,3-diacylglucosamine pyrophosphatase LpxH
VVKQRVKQAVSFITDYEKELSEVAKQERCDGVICGHIHHPDNKMIGEIHYLNSGDWVETMSALVEHDNGEWEVLYYKEWAQEMDQPEVAALPQEWELELDKILQHA